MCRGMIMGLLLVGLFASSALAGTKQVLTYNQWKTQQIADANNRLVRISNQLIVLRSGNGANDSEYRRLEAEMRSAQQGVDAVQGLTFEDYLTVYLSKYSSDNDALKEAVKGLKNDEVLRLLEVYLKSHATADRETPTALSLGLGEEPVPGS